jgi:hypothetical protein
MSDPKAAVTIPVLRAIWSGAIRLAVLASTAYMMWVISEPVRDDFVALWESGDMFVRLFTFLMPIVAIIALVHVLQESRGSGSSDSLRVSQIASSILTQRISKTHPAPKAITRGYMARAIFLRDNGGGNIDITAPVSFVASDEGSDKVLESYLAEQLVGRPGWRVIDPICDEVRPELMRAALGLEPLS